MPAAVCGKTIGRSMMPSIDALAGEVPARQQIRERDADDEGDGRGDERRDTVSHSERRTSSWRSASPSRPAPAPTIMLAAGSTTKATSSAPATAQAPRTARAAAAHQGRRGRRGGAQDLPGACTP